MAPMCNNFLNTSHLLSSMLVCLYYSLLYSSIPVTKSLKCPAGLLRILLYREGPKLISLHREGANPNLELSQSLATQSNIPRTHLTTSHLREDSSKNQSISSCVKQLDILMV